MDPSPFNSDDADVILRTSDGIALRAHKRILIEASSFFRDLFTLPQPPTSDDHSSQAPACVDISERGAVVHMLLMLTYPIPEPPINSLSLLDDVLGAASKYDMGRAIQSLRRLLVSPEFMGYDAMRVYAIACRHNLEEEAQLASTATLTIDPLDLPGSEELKHITADDYHRLLTMRRMRIVQAQRLLPRYQSKRCRGCGKGRPAWRIDFDARARAELGRIPTSEIIFSLPFLAQSAEGARCEECAMNMLNSSHVLQNLKRAIDALPTTI